MALTCHASLAQHEGRKAAHMQTMMQLLALSPDWRTTNGKIQGLPISRVLWGTELAMVDMLIPASLLTKIASFTENGLPCNTSSGLLGTALSAAAPVVRPGEAAGLGPLPSALKAGLLPEALRAGQQLGEAGAGLLLSTLRSTSMLAAGLSIACGKPSSSSACGEPSSSSACGKPSSSVAHMPAVKRCKASLQHQLCSVVLHFGCRQSMTVTHSAELFRKSVKIWQESLC